MPFGGRQLPVSATPTAPAAAYRLTDEQRELRDAVREIARERIAPRAAEIDRTAEFPWDLKELLATQDILGLPYPAETVDSAPTCSRPASRSRR